MWICALSSETKKFYCPHPPIASRCKQIFLSRGGEIYQSLLWFNTSSAQRAQISLIFCESRPCPIRTVSPDPVPSAPCEPRPRPMRTMELTKIPCIIFPFPPTWKEGNSQGKRKCYGCPTILGAEYSNKSHVCKRRAGCYQLHCM